MIPLQIIIDWNGFANSVLAGAVTTVIGIFATIWVYRYLYHRKR
jgi:hypothetical protein